MGSLKGGLLTLLWWKVAVVFLGCLFATVNQVVPPGDLAVLPDDSNPYRDSSIRVGGFVLITAIALFASLIPTGDKPQDKLVGGAAGLLGVLAAFGAGWYTLDVATQGNPGLYLYGATTLTGLTIAFLVVGTRIWAGMILMARAFAARLGAAFSRLKCVVGCLIGRLRR